VHRSRLSLAAALLALAASPLVRNPPAPRGHDASPAFAQIVDQYLDDFARRHPSIAAGNGIHQHDDRLEDFSARAIGGEVTSLRGYKRRLAALDSTALTPDERVDRRILDGIIDGWLLDIETVATWRRNPMIYASAISDGVHNLMTMESDPAPVRMRRVASKLRAAPALLAAARANIANPPEVFVRHGIGMLRGASDMLKTDLPRAFASADASERRSMMASADSARVAIDAYADQLEREVLPRAKGSFAIGVKNVEARYRAEELIDLPADTLLAIGMRELANTERDFRAAAAKVDPKRDPMAVWREVLARHPKPGELARAAQRAVDELYDFVQRKQLATIPSPERVVVANAPPFDLGLASMHSSPPLEARPVKSFFYVTDADPAWPAARQDAWLQRFNDASLAIMTSHEVMPGHYLHSLYMRRTPGKIRRIWIGLNPFPQPSSGQDGWAHYAEQLVVDEGFHGDDPRYVMAQRSDALTRICRLIVGIRLHSGAWTIDEAQRFFIERAHLPAPAARNEAERGTYDPTYGGYFLGKRAALKLRRDYAARMGPRFSLRAFHERVMSNGIAPWWAHRALMLPGDTGQVVE
jgi:uncharacterized protein (DUF885 family)